MKEICSCDAKDKELLACFREKLKRWKLCLSDEKDCHSIHNQLTTLFWDHTVYRTYNEARRLSEQTNDPSTGLQGTIIDFLDRNFMNSQAVAIRRLTDRSNSNPEREVNSLRGLIDEIGKNIHLYTRENYVCYDGISFNEAPGDNHHVKYCRQLRQSRFDYLSCKDKDNRSRDDKISSDIFAEMKKEIEKDFEITKEVRTYVNKWVAHAAAPWNREKHCKVLDKVSLQKLDECYQALIRIGKKVDFFIDEFLLCSVPISSVRLKNWEKPVILPKDLKALRVYWDERATEITDWAKKATEITKDTS